MSTYVASVIVMTLFLVSGAVLLVSLRRRLKRLESNPLQQQREPIEAASVDSADEAPAEVPDEVTPVAGRG